MDIQDTRVGIYLENERISEADLSSPEDGNPGVGGTEFLTVALPYYFSEYYPDKADFKIFANSTDKLPECIDTQKADNCVEALEKADKQNYDILIWRPTEDRTGEKLIKRLDSLNIKLVAWEHNKASESFLNRLSEKDQFSRIICLCQEQLERLKNHNIAPKATIIPNGFDAEPYIPEEIDSGDKAVTYIGSLTGGKRFHKLAEIWPRIVEQVPDAELHVIGSGKLYDRSNELGDWGVASEEYEKQFRPYISRENGEPLDSVTFHGLVSSSEKIKIMQQTTVGVPNPDGGETFCVSAVEFQAAGTPVVTGARGGLLDTVKDGETGFLCKSEDELVDKITYLLKNPEEAKKYGEKGIAHTKINFSYDKICRQWLELFMRIENDLSPKDTYIQQNTYNKNTPNNFIGRTLEEYQKGGITNILKEKTRKIKDKIENIMTSSRD